MQSENKRNLTFHLCGKEGCRAEGGERRKWEEKQAPDGGGPARLWGQVWAQISDLPLGTQAAQDKPVTFFGH